MAGASSVIESEWSETRQILGELKQCFRGAGGETDDVKLMGEIKAMAARSEQLMADKRAQTKRVIQGASAGGRVGGGAVGFRPLVTSFRGASCSVFRSLKI